MVLVLMVLVVMRDLKLVLIFQLVLVVVLQVVLQEVVVLMFLVLRVLRFRHRTQFQLKFYGKTVEN